MSETKRFWVMGSADMFLQSGHILDDSETLEGAMMCRDEYLAGYCSGPNGWARIWDSETHRHVAE